MAMDGLMIPLTAIISEQSRLKQTQKMTLQLIAIGIYVKDL